MFNNLFGNKKAEEKKVLELRQQTNTKYPTIVEEIHNEFFTAGEKILLEATCLLKELEAQDIQKGKRLSAIGFGKTREAVTAIEIENKLALTKDISELVLHYKRNYPNNKFITEEQVKQICEKYGLVCGDTSAYKGFVPENKLSVIENFSLKNGDGTPHYKYGSNKHTLEVWREAHSERFITEEILKNGEISISVEPMKICAPLKDMEVGSKQKVVGYKIQNIPDPVVLQPVRAGYIIVCAWGDEASDEIVVNEKMN